MKKIYIAHSKEIDYISELYEPLKNADFLKNYTIISKYIIHIIIIYIFFILIHIKLDIIFYIQRI